MIHEEKKVGKIVEELTMYFFKIIFNIVKGSVFLFFKRVEMVCYSNFRKALCYSLVNYRRKLCLRVKRELAMYVIIY